MSVSITSSIYRRRSYCPPLLFKEGTGSSLINTDLDDEYLEIIEKDNLTVEEEEKLKNYYAQTNEVIKRENRLDKVARILQVIFQ